MSNKPKITEVKGFRQETDNSILFDVESKIKAMFNPSEKCLQLQRQPLKVKESVITETELKRHEKMISK